MLLRLDRHPRSFKPVRAAGRVHSPRATEARLILAVLPFLDLHPKGGEDPLGEGIAEELLLALNRVEGLKVVSRTTSFPYGGSGLDRVEVGRSLRADTVLGGTIQAKGDLLTLRAELVEVHSGREIWSTCCDFERDDLMANLELIIVGITSRLRFSPPARSRHVVNLKAFEYYLRGRNYYYRFNRQGMGLAAQMFRRSLEIDPNYARAWAGLANSAAYSYIYIERSEDQRELAESSSRRALQLDPDLAEAHASRGVALSATGLAAEAEDAFETALRLDPNLFEAAYFYARHCFAAGMLERAVEYFEWAAALRPEDFQAILLVAQVYHSLGVEDEAELARHRGLALVDERLERAPDDVRARYLGANALVAVGDREKGLAWARMARSLDPEDPMLLYNLGCIHALAGEAEEALDCLGAAIARGLTQKSWFLHDGDLDSIRSHPHFQELMNLLER